MAKATKAVSRARATRKASRKPINIKLEITAEAREIVTRYHAMKREEATIWKAIGKVGFRSNARKEADAKRQAVREAYGDHVRKVLHRISGDRPYASDAKIAKAVHDLVTVAIIAYLGHVHNSGANHILIGSIVHAAGARSAGDLDSALVLPKAD